ncbi:MAG: hypothetical protein AAF561_00855 [Planctomycetota bacterium]
MRNLLVTLGGVGVFATCVASAGLLTAPINQERRDKNIGLSDRLFDLPPELATLQMALGVFRGVGINIAWQRAQDLKNDGNYSEAVQLGEWITKLQPKFSQVWEFVSWDQAYNISVGTHTPEERWYWVRSGIDLLQRDGGGLDNNPNAIRLYQQLAWIYHHKVGMFQDQFNWYYKQQIADEWNAVLGEPPRDLDKYLAWLRNIAEAPTREERLSDGARSLLDHMREAGYETPAEMLRAFTVPSQVVRKEDGQSFSDLMLAGESEDELSPDMFELVPAEQYPEWATEEDIAATVAFLRLQGITSDRINLDPEAMLRDAEMFGAIDWRHPAASAIYFSMRGLERLDTDENRNPEGRANVRRQVLNSLDQLAQQGRVVVDPIEGYVNYTPDWPFWIAFMDFYESLMDEADLGPDDETRLQRIERLYGSGFRNRVDSAIASAEIYGDRDEAFALMQKMREQYQGTPVGNRYEMTLDEFLEAHFAETLENPDTARATMAGLLVQAVATQFLLRDAERHNALVERAQDLHNQWREINPDPTDPLYQEVPDFPALYLEAVGNFLTGKSGQVVTSQVPVPVRAGVWSALPFDAQDDLLRSSFGPEMYRQVAAAGFDPRAVFTPPPGFGDTEFQKEVVRDLETEDGVDRTEQERK